MRNTRRVLPITTVSLGILSVTMSILLHFGYFPVNIFYVILLVIVSIAMSFIMSLLSYSGYFTPIVTHSSFVLGGKKESPIFDWSSTVWFISKGAFIAGNKIHVTTEFRIANPKMFEDIKGFKIAYIFWEAYGHPIKLEPVPLGVNLCKSIDKQVVRMENDMVYTMPGVYRYSILIHKVDDKSKTLTKKLERNVENAIHIAPLEERLQIRRGNITLALSWFMVVFALITLLNLIK